MNSDSRIVSMNSAQQQMSRVHGAHAKKNHARITRCCAGCRARNYLVTHACSSWARMLDRDMHSLPVATPRAVSRHTKSHPYPSLVAIPISGRDPKEARPCRDTNFAKLCRNTTSTHPTASMLRHQQWVTTP